MHPDNAPLDIDGTSRIDVETTLVHELLHIPFQFFCPGDDTDDLAYKMWEQAIDSLARILVNLSRV